MATSENLEWIEINDFSGGLWTRDVYTMPPNAAQLMRDCYAPPQGGLEPFLDPHTDSPGALSGDDFLLGYHWDPTNDREYIVTRDESTDNVRLYHRTPSGPGGSFSLIEDIGFAAGDPLSSNLTGKVHFAGYLDSTGISTGVTGVAYNILTHTGGSEGIWLVQGTGAGDNDQISTERASCLTVHQDRIVAAIGINGSTTDATQLIWTDPGGTTFPSNNFLLLNTGQGRKGVSFLQSYSPSDLVIGMADGPFLLLQGDMSDPTLRRMDDSISLTNPDKNPGTVGTAQVPGGIAFMADRDGIYVTRNGGSFEKLSTQLHDWFDGNTNAALRFREYNGDLVYHKGFLFVPLNSQNAETINALVYDWQGGYWFTTTALGAPSIFMGRRKNHVVNFVEAFGSTFTMGYLDLDELISTGFTSSQRTSGYQWRSAPFRSPTGRQMEAREVQLFVRTERVNGSIEAGFENRVTATIRNEHGESQAITLRVDEGDEHSTILTTPCRMRGRYIDIQLNVTGPRVSGNNQTAMSIEAIRIGVIPGHKFVT